MKKQYLQNQKTITNSQYAIFEYANHKETPESQRKFENSELQYQQFSRLMKT